MISVRNFITWGGIALFALLGILLVLNGFYSLDLTGQVSYRINEVADISKVTSQISQLIYRQYTILFITDPQTKNRFMETSFQLLDKLNLLEKTSTSSEELRILNNLQKEHDEFESLAGYLLTVEKQLDAEERKALLKQVEAKLTFLQESLDGLQSIEVRRSIAANNSLREFLTERYYLLIVFLFGITLLSVLFFIFLNGLVMKPVKKLMESTRRVAKGDFDARVKVTAKNEFGKLARSYNRMLHELKRNKEEIEAKSDELIKLNKQISVLNDDLEKKVMSRTESLQESRAYLNQIIYTSPVAIATFNKNGTASDLNSSFRKMIGIDNKISCQEVSINRISKVASASFNKCWQEALQGKRGKTDPEKMIVSAKEKWYIHNFNPQFDENDELLRIICYSEDVSDQIYAHEKLTEKNKELESFVYSVSHDLKSPIFTIFGLLEMVKADPRAKITDNQERILNNIETKLSNMRQMISALLDLSRAGANRERFSCFELNEIVRLSFLEEKVTRKGRVAELEIGELPKVFADRNLITQLFRNLTSNSFKYSSAEKPLKISFTSLKDGEMNQFIYSDNGNGIEARLREKVFEVFYRVNPREGEGAGVGLTIINKIIESHGGKIWIEDQEGPGTTFKFTLPLCEKK